MQITHEFVPGPNPTWHHAVFLKLYTSVLHTEFFRVISDRDWKTLCVIALHMNRLGQCYPSRNHIADVLHVDPSTASTRIQSLLAFRWHGTPLIWAVRDRLPDGRQGRQHYTILSGAPMGMDAPLPKGPASESRDGNDPEPSSESPFSIEIDHQWAAGAETAWTHDVFVKLYTSALRSQFFSAISDRDWKTLCVIALHMDAQGQCHPTTAQLAYHLGVDYGTASKRVRSLLAFRWQDQPLLYLERVRGPHGKWSSQSYTILPVSPFGMGPEQPLEDPVDSTDGQRRPGPQARRIASGRKPNLAYHHWSIIQRGKFQRGKFQCGKFQCGKSQRVSKKNQITNQSQNTKKNHSCKQNPSPKLKSAAADARAREANRQGPQASALPVDLLHETVANRGPSQVPRSLSSKSVSPSRPQIPLETEPKSNRWSPTDPPLIEASEEGAPAVSERYPLASTLPPGFPPEQATKEAFSSPPESLPPLGVLSALSGPSPEAPPQGSEASLSSEPATVPGWTPADESALQAFRVSDVDRSGAFAVPDPLMRWLCAALGKVQANATDYRAVHEGWAALQYDALAVRAVAQQVLEHFQPAYPGHRIQSCRYFLPAWHESAKRQAQRPHPRPSPTGTSAAPRGLTPRERNHRAALQVLAEMAAEDATVVVYPHPNGAPEPGSPGGVSS